MINTILNDRYRIEVELGRGGMGVVYRAHDLLLNRPVALKVLNTTGLGTAGKARLLSEARAAAKLNHPNVVAVHDAGEADGSPFIVMELVEGQTLRSRPPASLDETLTFTRQILGALDHAHSAGIIHRDIKPENVIVTQTQVAKLMDFGLARTVDAPHLTEDGALVGTFAYLAPEIIQGQDATVQSDLYALGIVLYELTAHRPPFPGTTLYDVLTQKLTLSVTPPSQCNPEIPTWLDNLILQLLSKQPEERPLSAKDVLQVMEQSTLPIASVRGMLSPKNNLPTQLSTFIGREKEIARLRHLLAPISPDEGSGEGSDLSRGEAQKTQEGARPRLVTLTGSGGIGKTRLAIQTARQCLGDYPHGAWLVELAPLTDPDLVPGAVATVLGVRDEKDRPVLTALTDYLREKTLLLVLDNCEHMIDACALLAENLLRYCPDLHILASSREALGVEGEVAVRVPSLSLPPTEHPAREILEQSEAVQLFLARATTALPGFELTDTNAAAITQVCHRLGGIALAIELAAARVKMLKVEQIATRLDDAFRLLTGGSRTSLPRQQTLRATIDWSYNLLSDAECMVLRRLSVFAGGWTLEAAEAVCASQGVEAYEVLDLLTQLVNKSLAVVEREPFEEVRYHLLETTRQYAREKLLEHNEGEAVRSRHLDYYLKLGEIAKIHLRSAEWLQWQKRLKSDWDNFRAALDWALTDRSTSDAVKGLRLANAYYWILPEHTRSWRESLDWIQKGLALVTQSAALVTQSAAPVTGTSQEDRLLRADALSYAGYLTFLLENVDLGCSMLEESVALYRADPLADPRDLAEALFRSAEPFQNKGDPTKARALASEGAAICRALGSSAQWELAEALYVESSCSYWDEDYETARAQAQESKTLFEQLGDSVSAAKSLNFCGTVAREQGDYAAACAHYEEALRLLQQAKEMFPDAVQFYFVNFTGDLARLDRLMGNYVAAQARFEEILPYYRDIGDRSGASWSLRELGRIMLAQGNYASASEFLRESLLLTRDMKSEPFTATSLAALAEAFRGQGQLVKAAHLLGALETEPKHNWSPSTRDDYAKCVKATQAALGEAAFVAAYAEGRALTLEQAVVYALEAS